MDAQAAFLSALNKLTLGNDLNTLFNIQILRFKKVKINFLTFIKINFAEKLVILNTIELRKH